VGAIARRFAVVAAVLVAAAQVPSERTQIFICGSDQTLPSVILLHWTNLVLAGDSRWYVPCAEGVHSSEHREMREIDVINRGLQSKDPEAQQWAAWARVRISDSLGAVRPRPFPEKFLPACNAEVQYFGQFESLRRWEPGPAFRLLRNSNNEVRKEAAYAVGVELSRRNLNAEVVTAAVKELRVCWLTQSDPDVQGLLLEALGAAA
jgi:hypothetical protein